MDQPLKLILHLCSQKPSKFAYGTISRLHRYQGSTLNKLTIKKKKKPLNKLVSHF